jgi:septal ring factor EnvC (AmiA/AmiB activator)
MVRLYGFLTVFLVAGAAYGQNATPQDLQKVNAELKAELAQAQDRKAELSTRVAELEKQNNAQAAQIETLQKQAEGFADRTLFLGAHFAAWQQFIAANPAIQYQWEVFEAMTGLGNNPRENPVLVDTNWPLSSKK